MKKSFLVLVMLLMSITLFSQKTKAQVRIYNPYRAMANTRLTNRIHILRTRRALQRKAAMRANRRAKKRNIQKRKQRVSLLENIIDLKFRIDIDLTKRNIAV